MPDLLQYLKPVFYRHDQIQQHRGDPSVVLLQKDESLLSVFSLKKIIICFKHSAEDDTVYLHIIND